MPTLREIKQKSSGMASRRGSVRYGCVLLSAMLLAPFALGQGASDVKPTPRWETVAASLRQQIKHEMMDKGLPAMAIALVEDQHVVWSEGFGFEDAEHKVPASADTVFRVGSVSKLFTDIGVMQMVEERKLDLDAPVSSYLPDFKPKNPFGQPITLRELMAHRSGLVREPPVGHYFDDSGATLEQTVNSLNQTTLVYAPGTRMKYSNAAIATVGDALQSVSGEPYAAYLKRTVLGPIGMSHSAFGEEPGLMGHLAAASMWSYDGLMFPAPKFQLGEGSAGCMYSTVGDLGRFLSVLFAGGRSDAQQVIATETLNEMWRPQYVGAASRTFGLGFQLGTLEGHRTIGHGGAIYGFATELEALPDDKLGVVVITTLDGANAVVNHLADDALRAMLAVQKGAALAVPVIDRAIDPALARKADGQYWNGQEAIELREEAGRLFLLQSQGGMKAELREREGVWVKDGRVSYDPAAIRFHGDGTNGASLEIGTKVYVRRVEEKPDDAPPAIKELVGEYGWTFDKLYAFEERGRLKLLVEWFDFAELEAVGKDRFRFPESGLYQGEMAVFDRGNDGAVTGVRVGGVLFPKLPTAADGAVFQIKPVKPVTQLRTEALASTPPAEKGAFRPADLVELNKLDPTIKLDIRYATNRNFLGAPLYLRARAYMQRPAAEAVVRASEQLHKLGFGLLIHDSYRPWYVTKMFWEGTPPEGKIFVADPSQGSRHNRGCAVDLTLYDLKTSKPLVMTGGYDEMSERSYPFYSGGTAQQRWQRNLLRKAMEREGFTVYEFEWWHFDYQDYPHYAISNLTFEELDRSAKRKRDSYYPREP